MPASGGHSVCWSFYAAIDEALEAGDTRRLRLLWEVSNQVQVRLRLNPSPHQLVLDRLSLSDELRITSLGGGTQSFFEMCCDVFNLPSVAADPKISCPKFVSCLKEYGILYKGKAVDKPMGHAMLACMVFALDGKSREAVRLMERVDPKSFDDHTKVMRCCQRIKSSASGVEHTEMLPAGAPLSIEPTIHPIARLSPRWVRTFNFSTPTPQPSDVFPPDPQLELFHGFNEGYRPAWAPWICRFFLPRERDPMG